MLDLELEPDLQDPGCSLQNDACVSPDDTIWRGVVWDELIPQDLQCTSILDDDALEVPWSLDGDMDEAELSGLPTAGALPDEGRRQHPGLQGGGGGRAVVESGTQPAPSQLQASSGSTPELTAQAQLQEVEHESCPVPQLVVGCPVNTCSSNSSDSATPPAPGAVAELALGAPALPLLPPAPPQAAAADVATLQMQMRMGWQQRAAALQRISSMHWTRLFQRNEPQVHDGGSSSEAMRPASAPCGGAGAWPPWMPFVSPPLQPLPWDAPVPGPCMSCQGLPPQAGPVPTMAPCGGEGPAARLHPALSAPEPAWQLRASGPAGAAQDGGAAAGWPAAAVPVMGEGPPGAAVAAAAAAMAAACSGGLGQPCAWPPPLPLPAGVASTLPPGGPAAAWPVVPAGALAGMPFGSASMLLEGCGRSREQSLMRYRAKRASRAYTKRIRYHLRKAMADSRQRYRGRFVKKEHGRPDAAEASAMHHQLLQQLEPSARD